MGASWPVDRDAREVRRERLEGGVIQWDPGHGAAVLKVVEFSDYQCPACKRQWGDLEPTLTSFGDRLRHGLVNFPLGTNHPWAFRAAVAGVCVADIWPDQALAFKSEMYRLQPSLSVETVDDGVFGFLAQRGLSEATFRTCYLKDPSIDRVLRHLELGQSVGVQATPTYIANGEVLPLGNVASLSTEPVRGTVTLLGEAADPATSTYRLEVELPNADGRLKAGMLARLKILRRSVVGAVTAPLFALLHGNGGLHAFVYEDGVARRREVSGGIVDGERQQVLAGLAPGDLLIVKGQRDLEDGQKVSLP